MFPKCVFGLKCLYIHPVVIYTKYSRLNVNLQHFAKDLIAHIFILKQLNLAFINQLEVEGVLEDVELQEELKAEK
jgi:hypothetical protein